MSKQQQQQFIRGSCIGRGSFGTVHLAYDKSDGHIFAVKSVPTSQQSSSILLDSLENEIRMLKSLRSPYIISYLGDSTTPGWRNLHLEYIPGGTLADVAGKISQLHLRHVIRRLLLALHYLHSTAGVVHGDVKGRNILMGSTPGSAKLADFGGGGTVLWMAPEVARGEAATAAADVWSVGCTVIEAVRGGTPWGENADRIGLVDIGYGSGVPECPLGLGLSELGRDFVGRCLRREKGERWEVEKLLGHPFMADVEEVGSSGSPRSVMDWVGSEFEDDDDEEEEEEEVGPVGREIVIRELAEGCKGLNYWDHDNDDDEEEWMMVRSMESESESESSSSTSCCDFGIIVIMEVLRANSKILTWVLLLRVMAVNRKFMRLGFLGL